MFCWKQAASSRSSIGTLVCGVPWGKESPMKVEVTSSFHCNHCKNVKVQNVWWSQGKSFSNTYVPTKFRNCIKSTPPESNHPKVTDVTSLHCHFPCLTLLTKTWWFWAHFDSTNRWGYWKSIHLPPWQCILLISQAWLETTHWTCRCQEAGVSCF